MRKAILSLILATLAVGVAFVVAYGTEPSLAQSAGGIDTIMLVRRLQWPLVALSLGGCLGLIGLVAMGRRRAWWLLVLAPVLFLLYQRFAGAEWRRLGVLENPPFVTAERATFLANESPVVGVMFEGNPYAYPVGCLFTAPVVLHAEGDRRMLLMHSPYAGRPRAFAVERSLKARELDIVSMPAGAMLLYNSRLGEFINAFTGATPAGSKPRGFGAAIPTSRMTWQQWRSLHPETRVLAVAYRVAGEKVKAIFPCPPTGRKLAPEARVALLVTTPRPVALRPERMLSGAEPLNFTVTTGPADGSAIGAGAERKTHVLMFREKAGGRIRVFERVVKGDLFPQFQRKSVPKKPDVAFVDLDTGSLWTADLRCIEGHAKGEHLRPLGLDEDLPWGTVAASYPGIELLEGKDVASGKADSRTMIAVSPEPAAAPSSGRRAAPKAKTEVRNTRSSASARH